jgi:hypothetical protein
MSVAVNEKNATDEVVRLIEKSLAGSSVSRFNEKKHWKLSKLWDSLRQKRKNISIPLSRASFKRISILRNLQPLAVK